MFYTSIRIISIIIRMSRPTMVPISLPLQLPDLKMQLQQYLCNWQRPMPSQRTPVFPRWRKNTVSSATPEPELEKDRAESRAYHVTFTCLKKSPGHRLKHNRKHVDSDYVYQKPLVAHMNVDIQCRDRRVFGREDVRWRCLGVPRHYRQTLGDIPE